MNLMINADKIDDYIDITLLCKIDKDNLDKLQKILSLKSNVL